MLGRTIALMPAIVLLGCGAGVPAELAVSSLGQAGPGHQALRIADAPWNDPSAASRQSFSFAELDGIKLDVRSLGMQQTDGTRHGVSINEVVQLVPGAEQLAFQQDVTLPVGDFRSAKLEFDASYSIKAHCRTQRYFVYTTAGEVRRVDCESESCDGTLPADYDYYRYEFIYVTTAEGPDSTSDQAQEETLEPFSVSLTGSPRLAVLVDTSHLAACYDGAQPIAGPGQGLPPFSYHPQNASDASAFFPTGVPAFGIGYLPIFIWVSEDPSEALPVAETYASAPSPESLLASDLDVERHLVTTFAFREDGSVLAARARNFDADGVALNQYFSGFLQDDEGRYRFHNGEFYWSDDEPGRYVQDRAITGFERGDIGAAPVQSAIEDGPDCGQAMMTEHGNASRDCLGEDVAQPLWWTRIPRA